jgi:hypothetical protein
MDVNDLATCEGTFTTKNFQKECELRLRFTDIYHASAEILSIILTVTSPVIGIIVAIVTDEIFAYIFKTQQWCYFVAAYTAP